MKRLGLALITIVTAFLLGGCIETYLEMTWGGTGSYTIYVGDNTTTCGPVTAIDEEGTDHTDSIEMSYSNLNRNVPGTYKVEYIVPEENVPGAENDYVNTCTYTVISAINGQKNQTILYGEAFDPFEGVTARNLSNKDLTDMIEVIGEVDSTTPGEYTITYSVDTLDAGIKTSTVTITVVSDFDPELFGLEDQIIKVGDSFDPTIGVTATDFEDGDITEEIMMNGSIDTTVVGDYPFTYTVTDSDDNTVTQMITITVETDTVPVIEGAEDVTLFEGSSLSEFTTALYDDVSASDVEDGDVTNLIEVTVPEDLSSLGDYTVTYTVTDSDDNTVSVLITMTIIADNAPLFEGIENKTIYQGQSINVLNDVTASDDKDGDVTSLIQVTESIDIDTVGTYTVLYSVTDSYGHTTTQESTVTVIENEYPVFSNVPSFTVYQSETFDLLATITANDTEDGDLTNNIDVSHNIDMDIPGTYTVTYTVSDSYNQTTEVFVDFTVLEDTPPVITGMASFSIEQGESYDVLAGVTATDEVDGDLTNSIQINDTVDKNTPGDYTVTYTVVDAYGNTTEEQITVTVTAPVSPYSGTVETASATEPYVINIVFDVNTLDNTSADALAFSVVVDGVTATLTDITVGLDNVVLTIDEIISLGSVVTVSYTQTGTNDLTYDGFDIVEFTNQSVDTSNIGSGGSSYSGEVLVASAFDENTIDITFDVDTLDNTVIDESAFTIVIDGVTATIINSSVNFDTVTLIVSETMTDMSTIDLSYTPTGTNDLTYGGVLISTFQDEPVIPPMSGGFGF